MEAEEATVQFNRDPYRLAHGESLGIDTLSAKNSLGKCEMDSVKLKRINNWLDRKLGWLDKPLYVFFGLVLAVPLLATAISVWLVSLVRWAWRCVWPARQSPIHFEPFDIPQSWLIARVSVADAEAANSSYPERPEIDGIPFGFENAVWVALKQVMQSDDELWRYSSPTVTWENLCGEAGYVVIRNGTAVAGIVTELN